jgi:hypothetical protein
MYWDKLQHPLPAQFKINLGGRRALIQWLVGIKSKLPPHPFKQLLLPTDLQATRDGSSEQKETKRQFKRNTAKASNVDTRQRTKAQMSDKKQNSAQRLHIHRRPHHEGRMDPASSQSIEEPASQSDERITKYGQARKRQRRPPRPGQPTHLDPAPGNPAHPCERTEKVGKKKMRNPRRTPRRVPSQGLSLSHKT